MLRRLIVAAYKLMGFVVLVVILVGLFSYVALTAFYYVSSSWVAPVIVAPSDRRVLELEAKLAEQETLRAQVQAQQLEMSLRLRDAQRVVAAEQEFRARLRASVAFDVQERRATIGSLLAMRRACDGASDEIISANQEFAGLSRSRIKELFGAHLTTRDELVRGNMELAALAGANLALVERRMMLDERLRAERRQLAAMTAVEQFLAAPPGSLAAPEPSGALAVTRELLAVQRDYVLSTLAEARARESAEALEQGLRTAAATLERYDALLASIKSAPYLRAVDRHLTIAFVPYENVAQARVGVPVYSCRAHVVWCRKVGVVGSPLEGEVTGQDPLRRAELRGVMVGIELEETRAAHEAVLHVGRAPLFI